MDATHCGRRTGRDGTGTADAGRQNAPCQQITRVGNIDYITCCLSRRPIDLNGEFLVTQHTAYAAGSWTVTNSSGWSSLRGRIMGGAVTSGLLNNVRGANHGPMCLFCALRTHAPHTPTTPPPAPHTPSPHTVSWTSQLASQTILPPIDATLLPINILTYPVRRSNSKLCGVDVCGCRMRAPACHTGRHFTHLFPRAVRPSARARTARRRTYLAEQY